MSTIFIIIINIKKSKSNLVYLYTRFYQISISVFICLIKQYVILSFVCTQRLRHHFIFYFLSLWRFHKLVFLVSKFSYLLYDNFFYIYLFFIYRIFKHMYTDLGKQKLNEMSIFKQLYSNERKKKMFLVKTKREKLVEKYEMSSKKHLVLVLNVWSRSLVTYLLVTFCPLIFYY